MRDKVRLIRQKGLVLPGQNPAIKKAYWFKLPKGPNTAPSLD
jgi:hypothetical protein